MDDDPETPSATRSGGTAVQADLQLRRPDPADGPVMADLVRQSGTLDPNSTYLYLLLCSDFRDTCRIAELDGRPVGFVSGYRPPDRPDTIFVWQVGVAPKARGMGLATRLIADLVQAATVAGARWLESTVTPSNQPSDALFRGLARRWGVDCHVSPRFGSELLEAGHEPEERYRIGPLGPAIWA